MEEKNLFIASLACSLIGILLIVFIAGKMEVPSFNISDLDRNMLDQQVKLTGTIMAVRETEGLIILTLKDFSGKLPVVIFKPVNEKFKKGSKIVATGTVSEFKKEIQLTAKQVKYL